MSRTRPEADFNTLVTMVATQVFAALGRIPHPITKRTAIDLDAAGYHLELLQVLERKTEGNLDDEEQEFLTRLVSQLDLGYQKARESLGS